MGLGLWSFPPGSSDICSGNVPVLIPVPVIGWLICFLLLVDNVVGLWMPDDETAMPTGSFANPRIVGVSCSRMITITIPAAVANLWFPIIVVAIRHVETISRRNKNPFSSEVCGNTERMPVDFYNMERTAAKNIDRQQDLRSS